MEEFLGVEVHLYQVGFKLLSPKMPGEEGMGSSMGARGRGRQSESGPSLLNIGFLWREVDCPFLAFR